MLSITALSFQKEKKILISDITLDIEKGETAGITGSAGSGKNTLISLLAGEKKKYGGTICLNNSELKTFSKKNFSKLVSHNSSLTDNFNPEAIVKEWILGGRILYKKTLNPYTDNDREIAFKEMNDFGLDHLSDTKLKRISWTRLRMASLARSFSAQSDILLLEKPEAGLDLQQRQLLSRNIKKYTSSGNRAVIVTSCDLNFLAATCDRIIVLADGRIAEKGTPGLITEPFIRKYFGIDVVVSKNLITGLPEIHIIEEN